MNDSKKHDVHIPIKHEDLPIDFPSKREGEAVASEDSIYDVITATFKIPKKYFRLIKIIVIAISATIFASIITVILIIGGIILTLNETRIEILWQLLQ